MRSEWAYYDSLIPAEECQAIIDDAVQQNTTAGTV